MDERMTEATPAVPVKSWWRRNAVALIAVAVLLPATAIAVSLNAWSGLLAERTTTVEPGETVSFGPAEVGDAYARFDGGVDDLPRGTRVVAAEIHIDPGGEGFTCFAPVLRETNGAGREWNETTSIDRDYDEERVTRCDSDLTAPYTAEFDYLVPDDAAGPFWLVMSSADAPREELFLVVEP